MSARPFILTQRLLPQHALSRVVHRLARSRSPRLKNALIAAFARAFRPDMQGACEPDPLRYESFNAFFTRSLEPAARPLDPDPRALVCPVDGVVSQIGYLDGLGIVQAKGRTYGLDALLAGHRTWIERFAGGAFATLYLAPRNYHRVHMPLAGELRAAWYTPGRLFSVNAATTRAVADLFTRNERVTCAFETPDGLGFGLVLVGALFVGSIATRWHGDVTPASPRTALELAARAAPLAKGEEMGRFNMGSTVILLLPPASVCWLAELGAGSAIRMGQRLALLAGR
ncbi:MAG TPA: archaetidylserine decarboxylase [Steroidobacteraceae bacterium]|nr:archaetidylserine decarboxylase [Steroidobacteraceae bacterium]